MLRMSFFNGTLNREKAKKLIQESDKPIDFTYGFEFRHPTTYRVPLTKEKAYQLINEESLLDIDFYENRIHLNAYSENDMW